MPPFTLGTHVSVEPAAVFDALTDPSRLERWLYGTGSITELSGPLYQRGTTFVQRAMKGIQRPGGVVAADPPRHWHIRLVGMGERADLLFDLEPAAPGTHLRLTVDVRNGPRIMGPIVDRLTSGIERRLWRRVLDQIHEDLGRDALQPVAGGVYVLEGGGWLRSALVIDLDDQLVHLELLPGTCATRPTDVASVDLTPRRRRDHLDIRPLDPKLRTATTIVQVGSQAMLADGGHGLAHCPMTLTEFRNARPSLLGESPISAEARGRVEAWRTRSGAAFGEPRSPRVGAYFSVSLQAMGLDAIGFGVVKLLKHELRGVHVRAYATTFAERPAAIDERALDGGQSDLDPVVEGRPLSAPLASPHLALTHATFTSALPEFVSTALIEPDEILAIEAWKLGRGIFI